MHMMPVAGDADLIERIEREMTPIPSLNRGWFVAIKGHMWPWAFNVDFGTTAVRVLAGRLAEKGWTPEMSAFDAWNLLGP